MTNDEFGQRQINTVYAEMMTNDGVHTRRIYPGISMREYIATEALQGLLANPNAGSVERSAKMAVESADYLIAALNSQK